MSYDEQTKADLNRVKEILEQRIHELQYVNRKPILTIASLGFLLSAAWLSLKIVGVSRIK